MGFSDETRLIAFNFIETRTLHTLRSRFQFTTLLLCFTFYLISPKIAFSSPFSKNILQQVEKKPFDWASKILLKRLDAGKRFKGKQNYGFFREVSEFSDDLLLKNKISLESHREINQEVLSSCLSDRTASNLCISTSLNSLYQLHDEFWLKQFLISKLPLKSYTIPKHGHSLIVQRLLTLCFLHRDKKCMKAISEKNPIELDHRFQTFYLEVTGSRKIRDGTIEQMIKSAETSRINYLFLSYLQMHLGQKKRARFYLQKIDRWPPIEKIADAAIFVSIAKSSLNRDIQSNIGSLESALSNLPEKSIRYKINALAELMVRYTLMGEIDKKMRTFKQFEALSKFISPNLNPLAQELIRSLSLKNPVLPAESKLGKILKKDFGNQMNSHRYYKSALDEIIKANVLSIQNEP